jgi:hypothetical protein
LSWAALSLDLEPDIDDLRVLFVESDPRAFLARALRRIVDGQRLERGDVAYRRLVETARSDGLAVESYRFPFLLDDRRARSTIVHRVLSAPTLRVSPETLMLYGSFSGRLGPAILASYGRGADAIAVGTTAATSSRWACHSSARMGRAEARPAARTPLHRRHHRPQPRGCVEQGILGRLERFDWAAPAPPVPTGDAMAVAAVRAAVCVVLAGGSHPGAVCAAAALFALRRARAVRRG